MPALREPPLGRQMTPEEIAWYDARWAELRELVGVRPLPCPFCGATPVVYPKNPKREGDAFGQVRCENDNCAANPCVNDREDICDSRGSDLYKAAAIQLWNTRVK